MKRAMKIFIIGLLVGFPALGEATISSRPGFLPSEALFLRLWKVLLVLEEGKRAQAEQVMEISLQPNPTGTSAQGSLLPVPPAAAAAALEVVWTPLLLILCGS